MRRVTWRQGDSLRHARRWCGGFWRHALTGGGTGGVAMGSAHLVKCGVRVRVRVMVRVRVRVSVRVRVRGLASLLE